MKKEQTIIGAVPSKPNSYRIIKKNGRPTLCKNAYIYKYENAFKMQCGKYRNANIEYLFKLNIDVYLHNMRQDLDNTLKIVLDCLQSCKAIKNDNQCTVIYARKFIDRKNPRIEFTIKPVVLGGEDE